MKKSKIVLVIDTGLGNLNSLVKCVEFLGYQIKIIDNPILDMDFKKIIFPGVGSFDHAMNNLKTRGWDKFLYKNIVDNNKPYLGICIGMQILSNFGYENKKTEGLGLINGEVKQLNMSSSKNKIPHVGWNDVNIINKNELFDGIKNNSDFYFDHSYAVETFNHSDISTVTEYGTKFTSSIKIKNIFGTQFHPEKSADAGKKLLHNFLKL